jgi:hypothetical protein
VKFDYAEAKDPCKNFLTLISGVLVFSVAFSERIVGPTGAGLPTKWLMAAAWGSLIVAAIGDGVGQYLIFNFGQIASHEPRRSWNGVRALR